MKKLTKITRARATKEQRRADVSELLAKRMSYGDVKKILSAKYGVSQDAIAGDIKAVYAVWTEQGKAEQEGNLALAIDNCLQEIRRLRHNLAGKPDSRGNKTIELHPRDEFKYSMALLRWEGHLAKLQGLLIGRVDVTTQGEPMQVAMNLPMGPFGELEEVS
tara:strand:- start:5672 stop:6157 length:486 start_codon:yes stop_codon:yes gene_type:complete